MKTQEITNKIPMSPTAYYYHPNRPSKYHCVIGPAWIEIQLCILCKTVPVLCFVQLRLFFHKKFSTRTERPIVSIKIFTKLSYTHTQSGMEREEWEGGKKRGRIKRRKTSKYSKSINHFSLIYNKCIYL